MENFVFDMNTKLAVVYYNRGKPPHLFMIHTDVTLSELKGQLYQINRQLYYKDTPRVDGVVLSIDVHRPTQPGVCGSAG